MNNLVMSQMVGSRFASDPGLLAALMSHIGSQQVHATHGAIRGTCPLHGGEGAQNFAIFHDKGVAIWRCFSRCGVGGTLGSLVSRRFGCDESHAWRWLAKMGGFPVQGDDIVIDKDTMDRIQVSAWERTASRLHAADEIVRFPEEMVVDSRRFRHPYFLNRSYSIEVLDRYEVGFVPAMRWVWRDTSGAHGWFEDRVSIPIRLKDGGLAGFSGRRLDGQKEMKYKILRGTGRRFALYGLHLPETSSEIARTGVIHIMEGFSDVWRAWMLGIYNTVGTCGVDFSEQQVSLIKACGATEVVFAYDGDPPGQMAVERMSKRIGSSIRQSMAMMPEGCDPGDCGEKIDPQVLVRAIADRQELFPKGDRQ